MTRPKAPRKRALPDLLLPVPGEESGTVNVEKLMAGNPEHPGIERIIRELAQDFAPARGMGDLIRRNNLIVYVTDRGAIHPFTQIIAAFRDFKLDDSISNRGPTPDAVAVRLRRVAELSAKLATEIHDADWWSRKHIRAAGLGRVEVAMLGRAAQHLRDAIIKAKRPRGGKRRNDPLRGLATRLALLAGKLTNGRNNDWRRFVHVVLTELEIKHPDPKRHAAAFDDLIYDDAYEALSRPVGEREVVSGKRIPDGANAKRPAKTPPQQNSLAEDLLSLPPRRPRKGT